MTQREKRKFIRYDALHLLDYIVIDDEGNPGTYSMGRTIDVSIDGLKLDTTNPLKIDSRLLITIGIEDDLIDLEGRITHTAAHRDRFVSGVTFLKIDKDGERILLKYTDAFHKQK
jgi:hypothetical protein